MNDLDRARSDSTAPPQRPDAPGRAPGPVAVSRHFPAVAEVPVHEARGFSILARGLIGSEILRIAADIKAMQRAGREVCNLTVGDFSPSEFRIPAVLRDAIGHALDTGETNYPASDGVLELRRQIVSFYERELAVSYPLESVIVAGGARPLIYATHKAILDPGEKVLYPVPSWNNNHYAFLAGARGVEVVVGRETNFLPTVEMIRPLVGDVRLICINSPLNPSGSVMNEEQVRGIARLVVEENRRRSAAGQRALYLMWDQVYWMLTFGDARHFTPPGTVPESAAWTVMIDGISKAFAATGLRVGWSVAPPHLTARMRDIIGHVGAWAPRPEQVATARLLEDSPAISAFHEEMIHRLRRRLDLLHEGFTRMGTEGLPVESLPPQGAIYLTARFGLIGRRFGGRVLTTNEEIRRLLLDEAGFAVVPFQAFGLRQETGWMRLSVGAVSPEAIEAGLARVRELLRRVA